MDLATVIGSVAGTLIVIGVMLVSGSLLMYWDLLSIVIVIGGAFCSALVRWPLNVFITGLTVSLEAVFDKTDSISDIVDIIENLANVARKDSLLGLEKVEVTDEYLAMGIQMAVDGRNPEAIEAAMQEQIGITKRRYTNARGILDDLAEAAPAFGMIGTVIGLIVIMANLADPSKIGPGLAVALVTTLYGALAANMYFTPISKKLKYRSDTVVMNMNIMKMGVAAILGGENPRLIRERLENMTLKKIASIAIFLLPLLGACDPLRLKKCEWYLIPNPEADAVSKEGWVSVCVANQKLERQKCYYSVMPELANRFNGVPFRYSEMKYEKTFPKEITSLTECNP